MTQENDPDAQALARLRARNAEERKRLHALMEPRERQQEAIRKVLTQAPSTTAAEGLQRQNEELYRQISELRDQVPAEIPVFTAGDRESTRGEERRTNPAVPFADRRKYDSYHPDVAEAIWGCPGISSQARNEMTMMYLNRFFAQIPEGKRTGYLEKQIRQEYVTDAERKQMTVTVVHYVLYWKTSLLTDCHVLDDGLGTKRSRVPIMKYWMESPLRLRYGQRVFDPRPGVFDPQALNMYCPPPYGRVGPVTEAVDPYLQYIWLRACQRNADRYIYIIKWLASVIQRPHVQLGVLLILRAECRPRKEAIVAPLRQILGLHFGQRFDECGLTSCSPPMEDDLLIHLTDAMYTRQDPYAKKMMIKLVQKPGKYHNFLLSTDGRCGDCWYEDSKQPFIELEFADWQDKVDNTPVGEYEAVRRVDVGELYRYFCSVDLTGFDPLQLPGAEGRTAVRLRRRGGNIRSWLSPLEAGTKLARVLGVCLPPDLVRYVLGSYRHRL